MEDGGIDSNMVQKTREKTLKDALSEIVEKIVHEDEDKFLIRVKISKLHHVKRNAHYMEPKMFQQLVKNIEKDGYLSSVPLCFYLDGGLEVVSGNHRVAAAQKAGVEEILTMVPKSQSKAEALAKQLSHNTIFGRDDPQILQELYGELVDIEWKEYAYVDIENDVKMGPTVGVENFDFYEVSLLFLPEEVEDIKKTLDYIDFATSNTAKDLWVCSKEEYKNWIEVITQLRLNEDVRNITTIMRLMLKITKEALVAREKKLEKTARILDK